MLFREEVLHRQTERLHGSIVLTQSRAATGIVVVLGVLIGGFLLFAFLGEYSRTETVKGILSTNPAAARISVVRPGTVADLFVSEGSEVRKGDRLMRIDTDVLPTQGVAVAEGSVAALERESDLQRLQAVDVRNSFRNSELQLDAQAADYASQVATFEDQIAMQQRVIDSHQGILKRAESVADRGFVSGLELERRRQALLQAQQQLATLNQELISARRSKERAGFEQAEMRNRMANPYYQIP